MTPVALIVGPRNSAKMLVETLRPRLRNKEVRVINVEHGAFGLHFDEVHYTHDADQDLVAAVIERCHVMAARLRVPIPVTGHFNECNTEYWLRDGTPMMLTGPGVRQAAAANPKRLSLGVVGWAGRGRRLCGV